MSKMWYDNEISMGIMTRKYLHPGEKPEDFIPRVVSIFSDELKPKAQAVLENAHFLPAGRTLFGAGFKGKRKLSISNCYVIGNIKQDNIEAIFDTAKMVARIFSYGGGCGISIDTLRPKGSPVNNSAMTSSGAVSFLNIFDSVGSTIGQNGRRAALMVCLKCNHPDIEEFLRIKQNNEKLASMNISIKFTDDFMKAVEENRSYTLYFESEETGRIEKVINARDFFMEFCETQWNWGDPGAIFIDRVQNYHILAGYENEYVIDASNPCSEAFGISGFSCNLGSINVYNMVDCRFTSEASINYDRLKNITDISVRMLDEILDYGRDMQPLEVNKTVIDDWRNIGLGIFGLADAFVALGIKYGSPKSCEITENIIKTILKQAIITSSLLAKEKGSFKKFDLDKTLKSPILQLFPELHDMIRKNGLRNGTLLSIAPTGTISLFAGKFTGGLEPMFKIAYTRTTHSMEDSKKSFTVYARGVEDLLKYHGCEGLTPIEAKKRFPFLVESHEVPYTSRIKLQSVLQTYVDNAISSTVNLPNSATVEDIFNIYMEAWKAGVKGITVFRDGCKRGNILGVDNKKVTLPEGVIPEFDTVDPPSRSEIKIIDGTTVRESTSCVKSMYVTVNKTPEGKAFEIFTNASGGCKTNINTIARLISLGLRSGIKVDRIIEELRANQCPACQVLRRQGKQVALSCSNAIADAIESALGKVKGATKKTTTKDNSTEPVIKRECPECGKKTLIPEGKCVTCSNCGWSKCE